MEPFIGQIIMFGGNFAPRGWALCDGQLLAISSHSALFSILGTTYGGDGVSTFGLPDLRGRVAMHAGTGPGLTPRPLGQKNGHETHTLTVNQLPRFTPTGTVSGGQVDFPAHEGPGNKSEPNPGNVLAEIANGYRAGEENTALGSGALTGATVSMDPIGGGQSFNIEQPAQVVNFIIALQGTYPSRN